MKLVWIGFSQPDYSFEISQLEQVTGDIFSGNYMEFIRGLNKAVRYEVSNPASIRFPKIDVEMLQIVDFSFASFSINANLLSQLGYKSFLCGKEGNAAPAHFRSYKFRRVTL